MFCLFEILRGASQGFMFQIAGNVEALGVAVCKRAARFRAGLHVLDDNIRIKPQVSSH